MSRFVPAGVGVLAAGATATVFGVLASRAFAHAHQSSISIPQGVCPPGADPLDAIGRATKSVISSCWKNVDPALSNNPGLSHPGVPEAVAQCMEARDACYQAATLALYHTSQDQNHAEAEGIGYAVAASVCAVVVGLAAGGVAALIERRLAHRSVNSAASSEM